MTACYAAGAPLNMESSGCMEISNHLTGSRRARKILPPDPKSGILCICWLAARYREEWANWYSKSGEGFAPCGYR